MVEDKLSLRWVAEHKPQYIETRLFWERDVNRHYLTKKIGGFHKQASGGLNTSIAVAFEVGPLLDLSPKKRRVVELDYGRAAVPVRGALLNYVLKRLGLNIDPSAHHGEVQQTVLLNQEAVYAS